MGNPVAVFAASRMGMRASAMKSLTWDSVQGPVRRVVRMRSGSVFQRGRSPIAVGRHCRPKHAHSARRPKRRAIRGGLCLIAEPRAIESPGKRTPPLAGRGALRLAASDEVRCCGSGNLSRFDLGVRQVGRRIQERERASEPLHHRAGRGGDASARLRRRILVLCEGLARHRTNRDHCLSQTELRTPRRLRRLLLRL